MNRQNDVYVMELIQTQSAVRAMITFWAGDHYHEYTQDFAVGVGLSTSSISSSFSPF